jgi:hypothetical protein
MPRGRPAKQSTPAEAMVEASIAKKLGLDPDDPSVAAGLRRNRIRRVERRQLSQAQREDWAIDAYRALVDHLKNGLVQRNKVRFLPHMDIPAAIEEYPVRRRRSLLAQEVARWAYRRRVLGETYPAIADSLIPEPRDPSRQHALDTKFRAANYGNDERSREYEWARRSLTAPARTDIEPHDADSIRKALDADKLIWETAEATVPASKRKKLRR